MLVGGLVTLPLGLNECVNVCVCVCIVPWHDIQGAFLPRTHYSQDKFQIHCDPYQAKELTEEELMNNLIYEPPTLSKR